MARTKEENFDNILFWTTFILLIVGLVALFSSSIVISKQNTISEKNPQGSSTYYFFHQILYGILPGLILGFLCYKINPKKLRNLSIILYILSFLLVIIVFFPSLGFKLMGARSWANIGGFVFQPSEIAKLTLIIYFAGFFGKKIQENKIKNFKKTLLPFCFLISLIGTPLLLQPDLGTFGVICIFSVVMFFVAGGKWSHIFLLIIAGLLIGLFSSLLFPHQFERVLSFLEPNKDYLGSNYQVRQSLIAIGSGGIFGLGIGNGVQKYNYLPEPMGDTIFAIWAEETGFVGSLFLISLYLIIGWRGFIISKRVSDKFLQLLAAGITSWILIQAFINIFGVLGLIPFTGLPLPLVSYGGTAMVITLISFGILLNISKYTF